MTLVQSALLEVLETLKTAEVDDRIRQASETTCQALVETELASVIGRSSSAHRGGRRAAQWLPTADSDEHGGDLELRIPRLRNGIVFLPPLRAGDGVRAPCSR